MKKNPTQSDLRLFNLDPVGMHYLYAHIITCIVTGSFRVISEASP